jgi:hypothetical protein
MTTKLSNPHYSPEVQVKVSLLNFTITQPGLEEQVHTLIIKHQPSTIITHQPIVIKKCYNPPPSPSPSPSLFYPTITTPTHHPSLSTSP